MFHAFWNDTTYEQSLQVSPIPTEWGPFKVQDLHTQLANSVHSQLSTISTIIDAGQVHKTREVFYFEIWSKPVTDSLQQFSGW